jgi:DNA-binding MurR/RpiR family transcriptional regulator
MEQYAQFSLKQRQVAQFLLDHDEVVAFQSVRDVASDAGVGPSTVVRFCRLLGYEGFSDYQEGVRQRLLSQETFVQRLRARLDSGDLVGSPIKDVMSVHTRNIEATLAPIDDGDLERAVTAILAARTVPIFGSGLAASVAVGFEHGLSVLGVPARAVTDGGVSHLRAVAAITADDLVVVVAVRRYMRDIVNAAEVARSRGAAVLAITDSAIAPVVDLADFVFAADTSGAFHSLSPVGLMSVVHLLSVSVAAAQPEKSLAALEALDELYRRAGVLME